MLNLSKNWVSTYSSSSIKGKIDFEKIDFRLIHKPVNSKNVSFSIDAGSFIGIVGQSGSGKSTIIAPQVYLPQSGTIRIDDYDISKVDIDSLQQQIIIVPQDSMLLMVLSEIILWCPDATDEEIIHASQVACAHGFLWTCIMVMTQSWRARICSFR